MCAAGSVARALLIPSGHGEDFVVWQLATGATLRGVNIYAHHPPYPGGPYAYFPLFLYLELPMRWLSEHTTAPFVITGKLPIAAADFAVALLLYRSALRRGCRPARAAMGAAVFLLNPLVLYNSAYYGRFDTLACALLWACTAAHTERARGSMRAAVAYGLAVAAKTFPLFAAASVLRASGRRWRVLLGTSAAVLLVVSAPYLTQPLPFVRDVAVYDSVKSPNGLSWWTVLNAICTAGALRVAGAVGLLAFAAGSVMWARRAPDQLDVAVASTLVLFLLCSKQVLEQYLIWPMPWLIMIGVQGRSRLAVASWSLLAALTIAGLLDNETFHPFGRDSVAVGFATAVAGGGYLLAVRKHFPARPESRAPEVVRASAPPSRDRRGSSPA